MLVNFYIFNPELQLPYGAVSMFGGLPSPVIPTSSVLSSARASQRETTEKGVVSVETIPEQTKSAAKAESISENPENESAVIIPAKITVESTEVLNVR